MSENNSVGTKEILLAFGTKSKKIFRLNFVGKSLSNVIIIETDAFNSLQLEVSGIFESNRCFNSLIVYDNAADIKSGVNYTEVGIKGAYFYYNTNEKVNIILEGNSNFTDIEVCVKNLIKGTDYPNNYTYGTVSNIKNYDLTEIPYKLFYIGAISAFSEIEADADFESFNSEEVSFSITDKNGLSKTYPSITSFDSIKASGTAVSLESDVKLNFLSPDSTTTYGNASFKTGGTYNVNLNIPTNTIINNVPAALSVANETTLGGIKTGYVLTGVYYPIKVTSSGNAYADLSGFTSSAIGGLQYKGVKSALENVSISVTPDPIDTNFVLITCYSDNTGEKYNIDIDIKLSFVLSNIQYYRSGMDDNFRCWISESGTIVYTSGSSAVVGDNIYKSKDTTVTPIGTISEFIYGSSEVVAGYFYNFDYDGWYIGPDVQLDTESTNKIHKALVKYVTSGDSLYYYKQDKDLVYRVIENNNERITDSEIDEIVKFNTANE